MCLLKDKEDGFISELIWDCSTWWKQWFKEIRPWNVFDGDLERLMWIHIYGVQCHVWYSNFFVFLVNSFGSFICLDENMTNKSYIDIARVMVRVPTSFTLVEDINVVVDSVEFRVVLREDYFRLMQITKVSPICNNISTELSSSEESWSNHGGDMESKEFSNGGKFLSEGYSTQVSSNAESRATKNKKGKNIVAGRSKQSFSQTATPSRQEDHLEVHTSIDKVVEQAKY